MSLITPDFGLLFWMVVIFGGVFFILAKFGFPVITRAVEKRSDSIRDALSAAEQARLSLDSFAAEQQKVVDEARAEEHRILQEASHTRDEIIASAREQAKAEAAEIIQNARNQIAVEKEEAMQNLRSEVSVLSVAVAEKIIRQQLDSDIAKSGMLDRLTDEVINARVN